jgi:hypothetical protein
MWKRSSRSAHTSRPGRRRPSRRVPLVDLTGIELLDRRILPAVTATFFPVGGLLKVVGDALDNTVVVSRNAAGMIFVNNGAIAIQGGQPTVANTREIMLIGGAGNDNLSLDETNGALPQASIAGGDGNDVLTGGSGGNFIVGGTGNDTVFLGSGNDIFQWNAGDGSDVVEGQGGRDELLFVGSDAPEKFTISDSGTGSPFHRVRLTDDVGNVTLDLNGIETIDLNALGGADTITVNDQSATNLLTVNLNLNGSAGSGDGQPDTVIINGTNGDDAGQIASFDGTSISAHVSLFPFVNITGAEGANDTLTVNALGGNDTLDASSLPTGLIGLTLNGGAGNDTLIGSQGDDTFVWNPGDGSDTVEGQAGFDTLVFNGSDQAEKFDVSANGSRVRLTRDVGGVSMDLNGVEQLNLNPLGGADTVTVNDLSATDLFQINLNLAGSAGNGDGQADTVVVNGTNQDDVVQIGAFVNGTNIVVGGLLPKLSITGAEGTNDHLTVNALGGNDVVDVSTLPANLIGLTLTGFEVVQGQAGVALDSGGGGAGPFAADADVTGGRTFATADAIDTSQVANPPPQAVYQTVRFGDFAYTIPGLTPGASYTVRLHFAEVFWTAAGQRLFNVAINGSSALSNFDIFAAAGGKDRAVVREFTATADAQGRITIQYTSVQDFALSSAIEIVPV